MSVLNLFKPAPYLEEIQDQSLIDRNYRYWRMRTFISMYLGYALYYFTRKSFTFAMPGMQESLHMTKFELGLLGSILSLSYGASKFLSGILGDRSNPRYFMSIGMILTGILNILFGFSSVWWAFALFWGLNGWFQGWGWPPCAKLLTHWYSTSERGRWWSVWNTSHNIGGALIPILATFMVSHYGWRYAMYAPGVLCILGGFYVMARLRDTPQSLGLPSIEKFRNDYSGSKTEVERESLPAREILMKYILKNRAVWLLAFSYFFVYFLRTALNDWSMFYLVESKGYSAFVAGSCVCWFEIGGFAGSLAAGWSSDILFRGRRTPVNVLFLMGTLLSILAFQFLGVGSPIVDSLFMFAFGFFIFGPHMLMGIVATELSHKKAAATATGFIGWIGYAGAAAAGGPLGALVKEWGWDSFFIAITLCSLLAMVLLIPLWSIQKARQPAES